MDRHSGFDSPSATDRGGEFVLLPHAIAYPNDVWFWEEGQQQAEREADEELAAGEINAPMTGEEFLAHLEEVTGEKTSEEP